jgi:Uma2 family endonuclease
VVSEPAQRRITSDAFIASAMEQPESKHDELFDGDVLAMAVEIDDHSIYEPDAMVRWGPPLAPDAVKLSDPIIVAEVLSPSTSARDVGAKLVGYFQLPSPRNYMIVRHEDRTIVHHAGGTGGIIITRIARDGPIVMDPPGLTLSDCFPPGAARCL